MKNAAAVAAAAALALATVAGGAFAASSGGATLSTKLYAQLAKTPGNLVASPSSARTTLGMVREASGGETKKQLEKIVGAGAIAAVGDSVLVVGPSIKIADAFRSVVTGAPYNAKVVDAAHSNDDAVAAILGKVGEEMPKDGVIVGNAVKFKGTWVSRFEKNNTRDAPFYLDDKMQKAAPTMSLTAELRAKHSAAYDVVELPYQNDAGAMLLVVPAKRAGLAAVEKSIGSFDVAAAHKGLRSQEVVLSMPRFSIKSRHDLLGALYDLGLKNASCGVAPKVDFGKLGTAAAPICLAEIVQVATIDVDEEGTTAAAATLARFAVAEGEPERPRPLEVNADHPFLFFVVDKDGDVSFMGRVADPAPDASASAIPAAAAAPRTRN